MTSSVAAVTVDDCSELDEFFWVLSLGTHHNECDSSELSDTAQQMQNQSAELTKTNIYAGAQSTKEQRQSTLATMDNYLSDSRTVAWSKGEQAAVQAIKNGSSKAAAKQAFNESVDDYYAHQQVQLVHSWNTSMEEALYYGDVVSNSSTINGTFIYGWVNADARAPVKAAPGHEYAPDGSNTYRSLNETVTSETLVNGSTVQTLTLDQYAKSFATIQSWDFRITGSDNNITVTSVDSQPEFVYLRPNDYADLWTSIQNKNTFVKSNGAAYVGTLYEAAQADNVNLSDYVSASTLAQEYSTDYNSTGYHSYAWAMASSAGLSTADLNTTAEMQIRDESTGFEYTGMLFSHATPASTNNTWRTGVTYNASEIDGVQMVITSGENASKIDLDGEFTIVSMTGKDGGNLTQVDAQTYNYRTNNVSEYQQRMDELRKLQQDIQESLPKVNDPNDGVDVNVGGDGLLGGVNSSLVLVVIAGAAVLLLQRS